MKTELLLSINAKATSNRLGTPHRVLVGTHSAVHIVTRNFLYQVIGRVMKELILVKSHSPAHTVKRIFLTQVV